RPAPVAAPDVPDGLAEVEPLRAHEVADALAALAAALDEQGCDVVLRRFEPDALPAMLLHDRDGDHAREAARAAETDDLWGEILAGISGPACPRRPALHDPNDPARGRLPRP